MGGQWVKLFIINPNPSGGTSQRSRYSRPETLNGFYGLLNPIYSCMHPFYGCFVTINFFSIVV